MISVKFITIFGLMVTIVYANADSAGIVRMTNGLAYGGIPYGSISGMLENHENHPSGVFYRNYPQNFNGFDTKRQRLAAQLPSPIIITPNIRATAGLAARRNGPVQIYRLPGVIAPGLVGTINQIGY